MYVFMLFPTKTDPPRFEQEQESCVAELRQFSLVLVLHLGNTTLKKAVNAHSSTTSLTLHPSELI